ncbi:UNVERIFIED_CONTAM: response regulator, partial [Bacillus subtilis]
LERPGYDVIPASEGEEAHKKAETEKTELIVLDVMLPKLHGIEVCKQLRQQKLMFPILLSTAKDEEFDKELRLALGADAYMTRSFSP